MAERMKNIHGLDWCDSPGGKCTACCHLFKIPEIDKRENTNCRFQMQQEGCTLHNTPLKPWRCTSFHCSQLLEKLEDQNLGQADRDLIHQRILHLFAASLEQGETTAGAATQSLQEIYS